MELVGRLGKLDKNIILSSEVNVVKCPICENEVKEYSNDHMEHTMCEEFARCKDEYHYYCYQYAYGATEETIGMVTFHSYHACSKDERMLRSMQYKAVLELEKIYYKERIKG